jgi:hypothetical protein
MRPVEFGQGGGVSQKTRILCGRGGSCEAFRGSGSGVGCEEGSGRLGRGVSVFLWTAQHQSCVFRRRWCVVTASRPTASCRPLRSGRGLLVGAGTAATARRLHSTIIITWFSLVRRMKICCMPSVACNFPLPLKLGFCFATQPPGTSAGCGLAQRDSTSFAIDKWSSAASRVPP